MSDPLAAAAPAGRILDRRRFILDHTAVLDVPLTPEIRLHLASEATELWKKTEEELETIGLPPPYWAFAWAGGQGLARFLLDDPALVTGKRVLDFASGSGLVAIAAMKAGAASAIAAEIDPFAGEAIGLNADLNEVAVTAAVEDLLGSLPEGIDVVTAGDIFYEWPQSRDIMAWFERLQASGITVLVGDPDRLYLPKDKLDKVAEYSVPVTRALEDFSIKRSSVWRLKSRRDEG